MVATEIESHGVRTLVLPFDLAQGNEIMAISRRTVEGIRAYRRTCQPFELALNEVIVSPLKEKGWL
jgi:hypothetical protein